ncbi:APC family permease [Kyrpidia spormannii]|uniref:Uncharacterized protein n=2 Tax=Kyrpidia spormannii TaxID=2055160 RepID=A0ACA8ZBQ9_9BACL|nr:APC family permease [Kyrpidia spormannii]CAB3394648.1 conserved membrane protein of unknown function [Kyrpidia spormannii]CAB3395620.1 conserved membrane protein of unknown function [Kyrpidia spormannii]
MERLGKPELSTIHAVAQSLAIGPVFSSVFLAALVAGAAGRTAPLSLIIGSIGVLAVGWLIVLYARRYHGAGAIYDYLRLAVGPAVGLFAACSYFIGTLFLGGAGIYIVIGLIFSQILQDQFGIWISWALGSVVFALVVFLFNHFGARVAARFQLILTGLSALPLLVLAIVIIAHGGAGGNTMLVFSPKGVPISSIFAGVLFAITMFIGFEASASLGEETKNPKRSIPIAVVSTIVISAFFYLVMIYAWDIGFGVDHIDQWTSDPSPVATLAGRYVGSWLSAVINIALILDMLAVAVAFSATSARGWFALARHGLLPRVLALQSGYGTPIGGNLLVLTAAIVLTLVVSATSIDRLVAFGITTQIGSILIELIYVILAIGGIKILVNERMPWYAWIPLAMAFFTPVLALYATVWPFPPYPAVLGLYGGIGGVLVSLLWVWGMYMFRKDSLRNAGRPYDWDSRHELSDAL